MGIVDSNQKIKSEHGTKRENWMLSQVAQTGGSLFMIFVGYSVPLNSDFACSHMLSDLWVSIWRLHTTESLEPPPWSFNEEGQIRSSAGIDIAFAGLMTMHIILHGGAPQSPVCKPRHCDMI